MITNVFSVPAVVASFQTDGTVVGSVRSARGFNIGAFLEASAELFIDYGGHDAAAGFSLKAADWPEFLRRAQAYAEAIELDAVEEILEVDAELPHEYLKGDLPKFVSRFEPFGEDNGPLVFLAKGVPIVSADIVGKREANHLKLLLDFGQSKWPGLYWSAAEKLDRSALASGTCSSSAARFAAHSSVAASLIRQCSTSPRLLTMREVFTHAGR